MKLYLYLCFVITLAICTEQSSGQMAVMPKGYTDRFIDNFRCGVFVPPSYNASKKYPLVIYLHGKGDTITRDIAWYHDAALVNDPAIVLSPKCPRSEMGNWGNCWTSQLPRMIKKTFEMIDLIKKEYNIDEDRIYVYGISMGAIGTFGLVQKFPKMFAAAYTVCGAADPKIAPQVAGIPFWMFHGELDDVVPVEGSRGVYNAVIALGGKQARYTEFKGVKHDAWNHLDDHEIITWMLAQKRGVR
ncbi:MAG: alpha/beta hydrolase-fold protein [Chitinophagaceae bacterium]